MSGSRSEASAWYNGPALLEHLDTVELAADADVAKAFRMPVQWVNRPNQNFRGFSGQVASGSVGPGAEVRILPSGRVTRIARVVTQDGDLDEATAGQSVTLTFAEEVDCSRGDVISAALDPPEAADQFEATIVWMDEQRASAGTRILDEDRDANRHRDGAAPQIQGERQHAGTARCAGARR